MIMILCRRKDGGEPGIIFTSSFFSKDEFEARNPAWSFVECHTVEGYFISGIHTECIFVPGQDEGNGAIHSLPKKEIVQQGAVSAQIEVNKKGGGKK